MPKTKTKAKTPTKAKRKVRFELTIDAQPMLVDYVAYWTGGIAPYGHFEFRSPHQPPRRIPISETGYRSYFGPMEDIEAEASPQEYARRVALALIKREPKAEQNGDQLALF
jgi:hypothetical protein